MSIGAGHEKVDGALGFRCEMRQVRQSAGLRVDRGGFVGPAAAGQERRQRRRAQAERGAAEKVAARHRPHVLLNHVHRSILFAFIGKPQTATLC
jgi:hypothetical protein